LSKSALATSMRCTNALETERIIFARILLIEVYDGTVIDK
jgi:hypothetical protein